MTSINNLDRYTLINDDKSLAPMQYASFLANCSGLNKAPCISIELIKAQHHGTSGLSEMINNLIKKELYNGCPSARPKSVFILF